jgi:hypothetical protein
VTRNIRKACQARIKPARQPTKQILEPDRAHQSAVGSVHERAVGQAEKEGDLASLVWKYFAEEITQALIDVQELLERERNTTEKANK